MKHHWSTLKILGAVGSLISCDAEEPPKQRTHYDNPFASSKQWYVVPSFTENALNDGGEAIAFENTAVWLSTSAQTGDYLKYHLDTAIEQKADLFVFVIDALPKSHTVCTYEPKWTIEEFYDDVRNMDDYKHEFIDSIMSTLAEDKYSEISMIAIIEVDTLTSLITGANPEECSQYTNNKPDSYTEGVRYALTQFNSLTNIHSYIDISNPGYIGWEDDLMVSTAFIAGAIQGFEGISGEPAKRMSDIIESAESATGKYTNLEQSLVEPAGQTPPPGWQSINGFVSNVASYVPLDEPFLADPHTVIEENMPLKSAAFYDWSPYYGILEYSEEWLHAISEYSGDIGLGILIDTSRNGWGGANRPANPVQKEEENAFEYLERARLDRRVYRNNWCNQKGAGIGERPRANPETFVDAYLWVKTPGFSDGSSEEFLGISSEQVSWVTEMCDPDGDNPLSDIFEPAFDIQSTTGAMDNAPRLNHWHSEAFKELLINAHPPIE